MINLKQKHSGRKVKAKVFYLKKKTDQCLHRFLIIGIYCLLPIGSFSYTWEMLKFILPKYYSENRKIAYSSYHINKIYYLYLYLKALTILNTHNVVLRTQKVSTTGK